MKKIIFADSDLVRRKILQHILQEVEIEFVDTAAMALNMALRERPDLMVSSFQLPDMNGAALYEAVRESELGDGLPFILLGGDTEFPKSDSRMIRLDEIGLFARLEAAVELLLFPDKNTFSARLAEMEENAPPEEPEPQPETAEASVSEESSPPEAGTAAAELPAQSFSGELDTAEPQLSDLGGLETAAAEAEDAGDSAVSFAALQEEPSADPFAAVSAGSGDLFGGSADSGDFFGGVPAESGDLFGGVPAESGDLFGGVPAESGDLFGGAESGDIFGDAPTV